MNSVNAKNTVAAAAFLSAFIAAPVANAGVLTDTLGLPLANADIYRVTCPANATELRANVTDGGFPFIQPSTSVRLTLVNVNPSPSRRPPISATVTDNEDRFFQRPSRTISLPKGAAVFPQFYLYASKDGPLVFLSENYTIVYNCYWGPFIVPQFGPTQTLQNQ